MKCKIWFTGGVSAVSLELGPNLHDIYHSCSSMVLLPTPRSLSYNWLAQGGPANIIYTYEGRIKSRNVWICVSTWIVMCLQAMSKQWKEDWNKDECPPVPRIFWFYFFISNLRDLQTLLGLGFEFPHESAALQFTDTGCWVLYRDPMVILHLH